MNPQSAIPHPQFQLYVFDLDGTLIDSRRDLANSVNALLVECGAPALPEERVGRMVGDGAATLVARAFEASGITRPADALERFLAIYGQHLTDCTSPYQGVKEMLAACGSRAVLAVLTNKPIASTRTILERLGLAQYFRTDLVVGGDGPFPRKPDPAGLRWLMAQAGATPQQVLLVGDSRIDFHTARAGGTRLALARYGFGFEEFLEKQVGPGEFLVESPTAVVCL